MSQRDSEPSQNPVGCMAICTRPSFDIILLIEMSGMTRFANRCADIRNELVVVSFAERHSKLLSIHLHLPNK